MSCKVRVLFLDFDGVLNSHAFALRTGHGGLLFLDPEAVAIVNDVLERAGAHVVVSSTWRIIHTQEELVATLRGVGFRGEVLGVTPQLYGRSSEGMLFTSPERGHEIQSWLDTNAATFEVESFAIVDDDSDMAHLKHRLVRTTFAEGITREHADRLVDLLRGDS